MVTTRKRIVGTSLAAAVIGLSGLGAVAATGSEPSSATSGTTDRCDAEALERAIASEAAVVLVHEDGSRSTVQPEDFISPAMVEACPDLPAMRERAGGH